MDRSKLYTPRAISIDFNPKDVEERDPDAVLELEFYPKALSPKLRRGLGTMVETAEEASRILADVENGTATPADAANAERRAAESERDFTVGLSAVIKCWSLSSGGVPIPFSCEALESEGYDFIYKVSSAIFDALSPNPETENSSKKR